MIRSVLPAAGVVVIAAAAHAAVPVIGGPTYDAATNTGYQGSAAVFVTNGNAMAYDGYAVTVMGKFTGSSVSNSVPIRFGNGNFTEYAHPTLPGAGSDPTVTSIAAINGSGIAVGSQGRITSAGSAFPAQQAIRWDNPLTPVVLGNGIAGTNVTSYANGINAAGTAVGTSNAYAQDPYGSYLSSAARPVRWTAGTTTATPLDVSAAGTTSTSNSGYAIGIDTNGTTYGTVYKVAPNTFSVSKMTAVRWNAGVTALTELPHVAAPAGGSVEDYVQIVHPNGYLAGTTNVYDSNGGRIKNALTRWSPDGTVTALDIPATGNSSFYKRVAAINDNGTVVGLVSTKSGYDGLRPARWDAGTSAVTLLGLIGTPTDTTSAWALGVNNLGVTVGTQRPSTGTYTDGYAVLWGADGVAIDLNTLIDSASGWKLIEADSITDSGWVAGVGMYDPDGSGPVAAYGRSFLIQVPEPASLALLGVAGLALARRRRSA